MPEDSKSGPVIDTIPDGMIFDMDGVIFDSESVWKRETFRLNPEFGIDFDEPYRQALCGMSESNIRAVMKEDFPSADIDGYREKLVADVKRKLASEDLRKPGFDGIVELCRSKGIRIGLATSSSEERASAMFANSGMSMDSLFVAKVFGTEVKRSKPDPEIFLLAASRMGLEPGKCIVVEDSLNGLKAAYAGGFVPAMVVDMIEPDDWVIEKRIPVFRSLAELSEALRGII